MSEERVPNTSPSKQKTIPNSPHPLLQCFENSLKLSKNKSKLQNDHIYHLQKSLGWRNHHSQSDEYPITISGNEFSVRQVQRGEIDNTYGTGATVWPASMILAKFLEKKLLSGVRNKRVVDLGAGTGITSIAAAFLLSSSTIVCTDGCHLVVQLAKENIERVASNVSSDGSSWIIHQNDVFVQTYQWGDGSLNGTFDIILVSDCLLPKLYPIEPLVNAIDELSGTNSVTYMTYEQRYYPEYDPRDRFFELAKEKNLIIKEVAKEDQHEIFSLEDVQLWEIRRK